MRIAILVNYFPKLSETFILNQVVGLLEQGHDVRVFALERPDEDLTHESVRSHNLLDRTTYFPSPDGYLSGIATVLRLALRRPDLTPEILRSVPRGSSGVVRVSTLSQFARHHDAQDYDVYHAHFGPVGKRWDFLSTLNDIPFIVSFYGRDASRDLPNNQTSYRRMFHVADRVTVLSQDMREDIISGGCPPQKTVIQPLPVDMNEHCKPSDPPEEGKSVCILTIARFVEKKGLDDAIEAINQVSDQYDVIWKIAGDGPLRTEIESTVADYGLEASVEFLGWVTQERVSKLYEDAHLFLLPSKTSETGDKEGTPTVLLEAQASCVPVISTRHAGIPEIVQDGETGLLVPENDTDALSAALAELLDSKQRWATIGARGRAFVEQQHSITAVTEQLETLYCDVTREANAR